MARNRRKEPGQTGVFTIKDITNGSVQDSRGKPCPDETVAALKNARVISIISKRRKMKWETIEADALDLQDDLGIVDSK